MNIIREYLSQNWPEQSLLADRLPRTVKFGKIESALNQILTAIEMLLQGRYDCAVTLAGAAEGMLPKTKHSSHGIFMRMTVPAALMNDEYAKLDKAGRNSFWNKQRDWLKHYNENQADNAVISRLDAGGMIFRALSHLPEIEIDSDTRNILNAYFEIWIHDTEWKPPSIE